MRDITEIVRHLRKNQTSAEKRLWAFVRNSQLGVKIVRQKPVQYKVNNKIRFYLADFYCEKAKLIIEVDGSIHFEKAEWDHYKDFMVFQCGYTVVRFSNNMVFKHIEYVLDEIKKKANCLIPSAPSPEEKGGI